MFAQATVCRTPQWPPMIKNNATAAMSWPQDARIFRRSVDTGAEGGFREGGRQFKKTLSGFLALATVFRELVAERADADLEEFGGLCAVAICALKCFEDGSFFEFVEWHDFGI